MARGFDLTAEINLRGPSNIRTIVADIRRQLGTIEANVDVQINPATARNLDTLNRNFGDFNRTLSTTRTSADAVSSSLRNLAQAVQAASGRSNQLPRNLQQINNAAQNLTRQNNAAERATRDLTGSFEDFGRQSALAVRRFAAFATVTGVIYKVSAAVSSAAKDFIDFDKELVRVAQVTDTSTKNLGSLVSQITQLSTTFGVASKDLIQVSSTLAQAGLSARDTEKALKALALSALAPSFDSLNETVEGSIALMRQFGIGAGDLEKALGSVNAVAAKFAVEASDLITAIQRTGGVFATASKGVSEGTDALNEFIAVFTSVRATTRESAETIATGLRTIFTRIQRGDTINALKEYGVALTDLEGKFVGPFEAVRRLSAGLNQLDPRDLKFSRIVEELGGFRQIGKVIPLIQQFATAQAALKVAQTGQDSLAKDTTIAQQALARQISKVKEEFIGLIRSIGQSEGFQTIVKLSLDLTSNLIKMADAAKGALPAIAAIMAFRGASAFNQYAIGFLGGIRGRPARPQGANSGGYIRGYASGGHVPGTGNSDTVPAMLTPGEFVIRKKAVETIGASNLQRLNKYGSGGRVKFKGGGFASAPMVDDITANARGSVLPNKVALEQILQTGYGALDFDRTLKRTIGDTAYGKAKTTQQKDAVLGRYFRNPTARLADATSAPITSFGKQLLDAIKTGKVDPSKLSVISKSSRTPGLAEHIQELFGIPKANMIFTTGGSKEPALEALRQKGPRASRVFKSLGGIVQKFQNAGEVKQKNLSTQEKLNIARSQNIAPSASGLLRDLQQNLKSVGAAVLEPESRNSSSGLKFTVTKSEIERAVGSKVKNLGFDIRTVTGHISGLSDNTFSSFSRALDNGIVSGINTAAGELARDIGIGASSIDDSTKSQFLRGINTGTRGNLFEDVLTLMSGKFDRSSGRPFDFPDGLPSLQADDFPNLPNKWIDAKASFSRAYRSGEGSLENKTLKQLANEILAQKKKYLDIPSVTNQGLSDKSSAIRAALLEAGAKGLSTRELQKRFPGMKASDFTSAGGMNKSGIYRIAGRATGGSISGEDTVPALLTPGEFVINKKAAQQIGSSKLHQLNRADKIQGFNKGGAVGYVQKLANGGDVEARIQRYMMLFEGFLDNITNSTYRANRSAGVDPAQALNNSRRVAGREFADASSVVIRNAGSRSDRMAAAEASSRVISQYMQRAATSAENVSRSSSLSQRAFQAIQNSTSRVRGFFTRSSAANNTPAADGAATNTGSRFNLQNFGLSLAFIGPAIGDAIVNALGTDKVQNRGYSSAITGVTSSLAIGAQFGPMGAFAGAMLGAVSAVDNFNKGVAEAEIELSKLKIDKEADTAEKNIEKLLRQPNNAAANQNILASLRNIGLEESKNIENENLKRQPGVISNTLDSYFGKNSLERLTLGFYKNSNLSSQDMAEQEASQNRMGSDIARKALTTKIEKGFTFDQALSSFGTSGAAAIRSNILEADKEYRQKLAELNEQAKTDPKIAVNLAERQKALADKYFLLSTEAERALSADKQRIAASQKLAKTLELASVSITQTFENMNQALSRAKFEFEAVSQRSDELLNNQASPNISFRSRNILDNPNAYSAAERQGAVRQVSGMFGQDSKFVEAFYNFGDNIENTIRNIAVQAQKTGNNENISDKIVNELTRQMIPIFGDNRITDTVRQQLKGAIAQQSKDNPGGEIDPQKLLDIEGFRQIIEYSKASFNTLKNQFETLGEIMNSYGQQVEKATAIQQQIQDNLVGLQSGLINTSFRLKEIFGRDVDINARLGANRLEGATRFGINPREMDSNTLMSRRQLLMANREEIQAKLQQATTTQALNIRGISVLQTSLIKLDREIKNVDGALGSLPGVIEKNINDILGEIQRINSERENRLQAGVGFAEKLVGSTPEELADLNDTYSVLNRTLNGNLVTINQSTAAQRAYFETLNRGGSPVEAMSAAQQAFAAQTQKALGMFNDLVQISGLKGQEVNTMRADLLENFARAQGAGLQNSPIFRQIISLLRQPSEEDNQIMKLQAMLAFEQKALIDATTILNSNLLEQQGLVLENANKGLILAMGTLKTAFENAQKNNAQNGIGRPGNQIPNQPQPQGKPEPFPFGPRPASRSRGGIVYASSGGYLSKGSDTVPAMLSAGEFVVNQKASSKNLGLLQFMNEGGAVENELRSLTTADLTRKEQERQDFEARLYAEIDERSKAVPAKPIEMTPPFPIPEKKSEPRKTHEQYLAEIRAERAAKEEMEKQTAASKPITPEDAELERQIQLAREGIARRERNRLDGVNQVIKQNNARRQVEKELRAENPEMTDQQRDTLDKSLNSVFARKTPGVAQNADEVRLEIMKRNAQARKDIAYKQDVAKGTMTDQALEVYGAGLKSVAENPITQAATALGTAGAGAARTAVGSTVALGAALSGDIYGAVSGDRSTTLDAVRDTALEEGRRGINNMTGAGASLGEVASMGLGAISLNPESQSVFSNLQNTYRQSKETQEAAAANITAKRAAQAEQVVQGGSRFQSGADLVTELTSPSISIPLGRIAGAADKIADTRKAAVGSTQFVPVEGLQQAANNLYRRSNTPFTNPLSLASQNPMRFVPEAEAAAAAYSTRNLGKVADATVSSSKVAPKASSANSVTRGAGEPRSLKEANAGFTNDQLNDIAKKYGDRRKFNITDRDSTTKVSSTKKSKEISNFLNRDINELVTSGVARTASGIASIAKGTSRASKIGIGGLLKFGARNAILGGLTAGSAFGYDYLGGSNPFSGGYSARNENVRSNQLNEKRNELPYNKYRNPKKKYTGGLIYAAEGALIPYEPKGTDTVPAMLTPGEFVINRSSTQKHLPLLKAINNNSLANGGVVSPIYAQGGMRVGSAGIGVGQQPSSQDKALILLSGILQGINQLNKNLPAEKTRQEDPIKTVLGPGTSKMGRGLPGETPIQQAFREGRSEKSVKTDRQFGAAADRYEKRAAYELAKESRSQAYNDKQMRGKIARGEVSDQDAEEFRKRQSNPGQLEKERQQAVFDRIGTLETGSEYSGARMQGVNSRLFGQISSLNPNTGGATVQAGSTNVATTQIAGGAPPATMPNFDQIFGPLTTNVTQFTQALSTATPFLNQIATFASNTNFQSQQGGVSNNRDNGESGSLSLDGISQFTTKFEAFIGQLKGLNLPPVINVQGNHKVEVVFNGASTLENLTTESIQSMVLREVNTAMNKLNQDTEGALGGKS